MELLYIRMYINEEYISLFISFMKLLSKEIKLDMLNRIKKKKFVEFLIFRIEHGEICIYYNVY